jgi:hypothetical protein
MELAFCGLDCAACPAFHAAERLTADERAAIAEKWNVDFGGTHTFEDIDCPGCTVAEGHHAPYCNACEIRQCAFEKAVGTCADCADYGCAKLEGFLATVPEARANLEARRVALA